MLDCQCQSNRKLCLDWAQWAHECHTVAKSTLALDFYFVLLFFLLCVIHVRCFVSGSRMRATVSQCQERFAQN